MARCRLKTNEQKNLPPRRRRVAFYRLRQKIRPNPRQNSRRKHRACLGRFAHLRLRSKPRRILPRATAKLTGWNIVNGGVSGDTSAQALSRLPALLARKPKLVIVGIGGNDFLRKVPEEQTRANIAKIIETVQRKTFPPSSSACRTSHWARCSGI